MRARTVSVIRNSREIHYFSHEMTLTDEKSIQVEVFRVVMPCRVAVGYQHFGGICCLHSPWLVSNTTSQHRRPRHETSSPWKPQISREV